MTKFGKVAISLPQEQLEHAKRAVAEGRAQSVSAYVSEALACREREDALAELVSDLVAERGEPSAEDRAWAAELLGRRWPEA